MRVRIKSYLAAGVALLAPPAAAQDFDYYLLALTWTPSFCAAEADENDREQCAPGRGLGFTLHGLWPQNEDGWPEYCDTRARDPSRRETSAMADIMGSGGLAWYQWKKHGRCSGLPPEDYFATARAAYAAVTLPDIAGPIREADLERAIRDLNPGLDADEVIVTCRGDFIREVRICLDARLEPRDCGRDVLEDACRYGGQLDMPPER